MKRLLLGACFVAACVIVADVLAHHPYVQRRVSRLIGVGGTLERARERPTDYASTFAEARLRYWRVPGQSADYATAPMTVLDDTTVLWMTRCGAWQLLRLRSASEPVSQRSDSVRGVFCGRESAGIKGVLRSGRELLIATHVRDSTTRLIGFALIRMALDSFAAPSSAPSTIWQSPRVIAEPIKGIQTGGQMVADGADHVLLTLGDLGRADLARDSTSPFGKLLRISLRDGSWTVFARGLRSPGGLTRDDAGNVWNTDHGPKGGDEVNLLRAGGDYGWPNVSYGTLYESGRNPEYYGNRFGSHEGYDKPAWVFVPSVGPSAVVQYPRNGTVEAWRGDLLVASLNGQTLFRLRKEGTHLVYAEAVLKVNDRIRTVHVLPSSALLLQLEPDRIALVTVR